MFFSQTFSIYIDRLRISTTNNVSWVRKGKVEAPKLLNILKILHDNLNMTVSNVISPISTKYHLFFNTSLVIFICVSSSDLNDPKIKMKIVSFKSTFIYNVENLLINCEYELVEMICHHINYKFVRLLRRTKRT